MTSFLNVLGNLPTFVVLIPCLLLLGAGGAVLVSELAWARQARDWPRPVASLIGLLFFLAGVGGLVWLGAKG